MVAWTELSKRKRRKEAGKDERMDERKVVWVRGRAEYWFQPTTTKVEAGDLGAIESPDFTNSGGVVCVLWSALPRERHKIKPGEIHQNCSGWTGSSNQINFYNSRLKNNIFDTIKQQTL